MVTIDNLKLAVRFTGAVARAVPVQRRLRDCIERGIEPALAHATKSLAYSGRIKFIDRIAISCALNSGWNDEEIVWRVATRLIRALDESARDAPTIEFLDRAEFVSAFLVALADGPALQRWWFDEFDGLRALPASGAIRTVVINEGDAGIAALARLTEATAARVIGALGGKDAERIIDWIARRQATVLAAPIDLWHLAGQLPLPISRRPQAWLHALATIEAMHGNTAGTAVLDTLRAMATLRVLARGDPFDPALLGLEPACIRELLALMHRIVQQQSFRAAGSEPASRNRGPADLNPSTIRTSPATGPDRPSPIVRHADSTGDLMELQHRMRAAGLNVAWLSAMSEPDIACMLQDLTAAARTAGGTRHDGPATRSAERFPAEASTRHGGAFILLAVMSWLDWPQRWQRALSRMVGPETSAPLARALALRVVGRALAAIPETAASSDPALLLALGLETLDPLLDTHRRALAIAARAVPPRAPGHPYPQVSRRRGKLETRIDSAARALLEALATRLPGLAGSSPDYLRSRVLQLPARISISAKEVSVGLGRAPLDVLLVLAGLKRATFSLPGGITLRLREDSAA